MGTQQGELGPVSLQGEPRSCLGKAPVSDRNSLRSVTWGVTQSVCLRSQTTRAGMGLRRLRPEQEMPRTREREGAGQAPAACCGAPPSCRSTSYSASRPPLPQHAAMPQPTVTSVCHQCPTPCDSHMARAKEATLASVQRRLLTALVCDCCAALLVNTDVLAGKWMPASESVP